MSPRSQNLERRTTAAALAAAVVLLLRVGPASGHEGGPRLILEPNPVHPGGVVLIRGEDLSLDEAFQVSLVGEGGQADLAPVSTDGEGHFTLAAEMPVDTPVGTYAIQAAAASGFTVTSLVRIDGVPVQPEQEGAPPGQDEGLPALGATGLPAPSVAAAVRSPVPASTNAGSTLRPLSDPAEAFDPVPFVALAGAVGALGFLVLRTRRSTVGQTGSADSP